jgi:hypothetical protein
MTVLLCESLCRRALLLRLPETIAPGCQKLGCPGVFPTVS